MSIYRPKIGLLRCVGCLEASGERTGQEAVELHQELEVDIVTLGGSAVSALDVVAVEIDTYKVKQSSAIGLKHAQKWTTLSCEGTQNGVLVAGKRPE